MFLRICVLIVLFTCVVAAILCTVCIYNSPYDYHMYSERGVIDNVRFKVGHNVFTAETKDLRCNRLVKSSILEQLKGLA